MYSSQAPQGQSSKQIRERSVGGLGRVEDYPRENTCSTCCGFFFFLLVTPVSIVFVYHAFPTTTIMLVGIWMLVALFPWAFHAGGAIASDISGPILTLTLFGSVCLSFLGGVRCYYAHSQPMRQLAVARQYSGVYPDQPSKGFPDASYLEFVGNATIDVSKAVSYQSLDSGMSTFCAAPVSLPTGVGRYDFWAIGVDCCSPGSLVDAERFNCYDAKVAGVKTGWVLPHKLNDLLWSTLGIYVAPSEQRRDLFVKAVHKAEATHGIATPGDQTIFLRWTKAKKEEIIFFEMIQVIGTIVVFAALMAGISLFMTRLYQRFSHVRKLHRRQQQEMHAAIAANSEEEDLSARLYEFMHRALEDAKDSDMGGTIARVQDVAEHMERFRPPLSASDMCLMGVALPYVLLMLCVILCSWTPCWRLGHLILAPFWCATAILIMALLATPQRAVSGLFIFICCTAGYYIGMTNYRVNTFHYCSTADRAVYKDVPADSFTARRWDAGRMTFVDTAMLSTQHSVGFLYQGTTYCAAPVISKNAPCKDVQGAAVTEHAHGHIQSHGNVSSLWQSEVNHVWELAAMEKKRFDSFAEFTDSEDRQVAPPSFMQRRSGRHHSRRALHRGPSDAAGGCARPAPEQIDFWAIGIDCCDARKRFWCDGGDVDGAHEAVVVRAFAEQEQQIGDKKLDGPKIRDDREHFYQAINQAVSAFELPLPERPVLLRWGESSKDLQQDWKRRALGVIFMTGLASLLVILLIGIGSYMYMRAQRKSEEKEMQDYQKSHGGEAEQTGYTGIGSFFHQEPARPPPAPAPASQGAPPQRGASEDGKMHW